MSVGARAGRLLLIAAALAASGPPAQARELWSEGDRSIALLTALKSTLLVTNAPTDPELYPEEVGAEGLWRLRLDLTGTPWTPISFGAAYEQRLVVASSAAGLVSGILPRNTPAPYRIWQLDWSIAQAPNLQWSQEIDRAYVALHLAPAEITVGRQAIGWGRAVLFGAVDLFSPFNALEADREWRRGVDAVRVDVRLAERFSTEVVGAFGPDIGNSCFAGRVRGFAGDVDGELVLGWRAQDLLAGFTTSARLGGAAAHAELAYFRLPAPLPPGAGGGRDVLKAVLGASYSFQVGNGLPVWLEYHYSGFGVKEPEQVIPTLADPAYLKRYLRGDTQIIGQHVIALTANYEASPEVTVGGLALVSPVDGSGVVAPNATWRPSDRVSLQAILYVPWGAKPTGLALASVYGALPLSGYVQLAIFD